jgi:serine phosphatase RsbU (regulator of sigma subunit)
MTEGFVFDARSIPFLCLSAGLLAIIILVMLKRGDLTIRAALVSASLLAITWAAGTAAGLGARTPELADLFARVCVGVVIFIGPALLLMFLALCGLVEQLRILVYVFTAAAATSCFLTWSTDLVLAGVSLRPDGQWQPRGGLLLPVHLAVLCMPLLAGMFLSYRIRHEHRNPSYKHFIAVALMAIAAGVLEVLRYRGLFFYPWSVVPGGVSTGFTLWALFRRDLLYARGRGIDWGAVWELALFALMIPLVTVAAWASLPRPHGLGGGPFLAMLLLVPLYGTMQGIILIVRAYLASDAKPMLDEEAEMAIEELGEMVKEPVSEAQVGEHLAEILGQHSLLRDVALYIVDDKGAWRPATSDTPAPITVAEPVRAWVHEQRRPILRRELYVRRLGKLREPLIELFEKLEAEVVVPMSERGKLVGVVAARVPAHIRELDERENYLLRQATRVTARALVYLDLLKEALERIEMAKELEVAASSRVTREPGEQRHLYDLCEIIGYYHAALQLGGDWWTSYELDDGRVLVVMGHVAGHGVHTALVSATVAGACETAVRMRGPRIDVVELLQLLDHAVRTLGSEHQYYDMGCFAAIFDEDRVSFANAGHPSPWVCRRPMSGGREDELHTLAVPGNRLGGLAPPVLQAATVELTWNDIIVMCSETLAEIPNPDGEPYAERRLPRLLRRQARAVGGRICRVIVDDVLIHAGEQPIAADMSLVVVRMGTGRSRRRAHTTGENSTSIRMPAEPS